MTRKRIWEVGASAVLVAIVVFAAGGYFQWQERQRQLNQQLSKALDFTATHKGKSKAILVAKALEKGGDPKLAGARSGFTCLQAICLLGDAQRTKELLDQGAPVNARDNLGYTPLMMAVHSGDAATVRMILAYGADVNVRPNNQFTALRWAGKNQPIIAILKEAGAVDTGVQSVRFRYSRIPRATTPPSNAVKRRPREESATRP